MSARWSPLLAVLLVGCAHLDGFATFIGAEAVGIGALTVHYLKHPTHPACTVTHGPDSMVTTPVVVQAQDGEQWGTECLTPAEVRRLRHQ